VQLVGELEDVDVRAVLLAQLLDVRARSASGFSAILLA